MEGTLKNYLQEDEFWTIRINEMTKKLPGPLIFCLFLLLALAGLESQAAGSGAERGIPVLVYHRFGPEVSDGMTVTTPVFESHLKYLQENGYRVIPLRGLLDNYLKNGVPPDSRLVAMSADDAHISVYRNALPLIKKYRIPMTLFIYPSAVSNASYAMTWDQLRELKTTGLFDFQSHTYWHPNFKKEKKKLKPEEYQKLVDMQLVKSKNFLEKKLGTKVDLLAWPFGIYDDELEKDAAKAGYVVAFSIDRRLDSKSEPMMAQPRYLMVNSDGVKGFAAIVEGKVQEKGHKTY